MLNLYAWKECPHCKKTIEWLQKHNIPFRYLEIEEQPEPEIRKVIEVNGGDDWVVPTLEFNGKWRKGQTFDPVKLEQDLKEWGLL